MSVCPFDIKIHWNAEYEEICIEHEYVKTPLLDHNHKPMRGSSVLYEECVSAGSEYWFKDSFIGKPTGYYRVKGSFCYSQDWEGEWDSECNIDYLEKVKRRICFPHKWFQWQDLKCCKTCGIAYNEKGNNPCKGPITSLLR